MDVALLPFEVMSYLQVICLSVEGLLVIVAPNEVSNYSMIDFVCMYVCRTIFLHKEPF